MNREKRRQNLHIDWNRLFDVATTVGFEFTDDEMKHLRACRRCLHEFEQLVSEVLRRRLVIDDSDTGRTEIRYDSLSSQEIASRIRVYEKKYGMRFAKFACGFSCDDASPHEMTDYMDWKQLTLERAERLKTVGKKT